MKKTLTIKEIYENKTTEINYFNGCEDIEKLGGEKTFNDILLLNYGNLYTFQETPQINYTNAQIAILWHSHLWEIRKLYNILTLEYNAIENYNKISKITDVSVSKSNNKNNIEVTNENSVTPYNSNDYQNNELTRTTANKDTNYNENCNDTTITHSEDTHGNIGVMSTQNMIQQEIDLTKFNYYETVISKYILPNIVRGVLL